NKARDFEQEWRSAWTNFKSEAQTAIVQASSLLDQLGPSLRSGLAAGASALFGDQDSHQFMTVMGKGMLKGGLGSQMTQDNATQFYGSVSKSFFSETPFGSGDTSTTSAAAKQRLQETQQLIGLLGPLASIDQQVQEKENQINLARLNGVPITK